MTRQYRQVRRAAGTQDTRAHIISAALAVLPERSDLPVDLIAQRADVAVQTVYAHFGSKSGLLIAVIDAVQRDAGLYEGFEEVWSSPDGEAALARMAEATARLWQRGWSFVEFLLRTRRADPEVEQHMQVVDLYRRSDLEVIVGRLHEEGRLRPGLDVTAATDLCFALTTPAVFESLRLLGKAPREAIGLMVGATVAAVVGPRPGSPSLPPPDWSMARDRAARVIEAWGREGEPDAHDGLPAFAGPAVAAGPEARRDAG